MTWNYLSSNEKRKRGGGFYHNFVVLPPGGWRTRLDVCRLLAACCEANTCSGTCGFCSVGWTSACATCCGADCCGCCCFGSSSYATPVIVLNPIKPTKFFKSKLTKNFKKKHFKSPRRDLLLWALLFVACRCWSSQPNMFEAVRALLGLV